jgi:rhodanese-related sulfurtransferase
LLAVLAVALCVTWAWAEQGEVPEINYGDLAHAVQARQVTLIDCNGTDSYVKRHIPGAIDFNTHRADLARLLPKSKDALIVAYCGGPR